MQTIFVPIINQQIPSDISTQSFACPRLPALRVELEMDQPSFECIEPFLRLRSLQMMAQKLLETLKRELRWTVEQYDYALQSLEPSTRQAAQATFNEALQRRCLALHACCEETLCEIAKKMIREAGRFIPSSRSEREFMAAQSAQTVRELPVERHSFVRTGAAFPIS